MASKKELRRKRRQEKQEKHGRGKMDPATLFIVVVVAAIVALTAVGLFLRRDSEPPPWPGAVWSPEHGHWH